MEMLSQLCGNIAALPPIAALAARLARQAVASPSLPPFLHAAPLIGAARVPLLAALASRQTAPLLYVVPNADMAQRAIADLRLWLPTSHTLLYPANDTLPYEYMSPGPDVVRQRLHTLQVLADLRASEGDQPAAAVIVAPIRALLQPTLTPQEIDATTTRLALSVQMTQDRLLRRWLEQGYRMVPMVEQPGDMARRGGIVDIWPPGDTQPLRIEWFGDEIDSLRRFDRQSQRSERPLNQAAIGPASEVPLWRTPQAMAWLQQLESSSLRPEAAEEWQHRQEQLAAGERFDGWAFFAPFFQQQDSTGGRCSLLAHLPAGAAVLLSEAVQLGQEAHDFHAQSEEQRANLVSTGELVPDFPRPYLLWADMLAQAAPFALVDISNNEHLPADDLLAAGREVQHIELSAHPARPLFMPAELFGGQLRRLVDDIAARLRSGEDVAVVTAQAARIEELVAEALHAAPADASAHANGSAPGRLLLEHGSLDEGWRVPALRLSLYTDTEIFGWRQRRSLAERRERKERSASERAALLHGLKPGDYVVHIEHGIAVYEGLLRRTVGGIEREYLNLRYAAGDRLYVPVDQVDRVARYIGSGDAVPQLTRLGTQEWERAKRKARAAVQDLAEELLRIYARREASQGHTFAPDNEWQRQLEETFPYIETDDQLRALSEVKADMQSPRPMDRLICGDVGFGKTEVALRAAFKAVQDGKQVAVLVPTTVLAQQHYTTFSQRMAAFPVKVEMLSRFRSPKEQEVILRDLSRGRIDILVGTHRLLSKDVHFKELGLLIVDEEQRFGVRHKEHLKQIRAEVDVLTLTATPIPRTLHMTLAGIRDMSVISTPPEERIPIKTYVVPHNEGLIRDAVRRELERDGQVYFLHNRVQSIYHIAARLRHLVPEASIGVAHGQLDERELEKTMLDFFSGTYDVLVCTTIIENGLDVSSANTLIVDDATNYGLAQLYQLRGRVGRSANRAYAYLLYKQDKPMTPEAQERLQAIQEATELGAGFRISMRDLEIRGAGNLLGAEQSGQIAAVGFDLYSRLLEQAVRQLKQMEDEQGQAASQRGESLQHRERHPVKVSEKVLVSPLVTLDLPLTAYLPEDYIDDEAVRLSVYQRMVDVQSPEEVRKLRQELQDRFGELPTPAAHLLVWLTIKALALAANVSSVITTEDEFIVRLPVMSSQQREQLGSSFGTDAAIRTGTQFVRLNRRMAGEAWEEKLITILEVLRGSQAETSKTARRRARR